MNLDVKSLGAFNRMAHEGANRAAERLTWLTDIETFVEITKIDLATIEELGDGGEETHVGVRIDLDGALTGRAILAFRAPAARTIADVLVSETSVEPDEELDRSAIQEIGNIMTSGFVDGWADQLETTIDISPPTSVEGSSRELLEDGAETDPDKLVLSFESRVRATDEAVDFRFYLFPEPDSLSDLLEPEADEDVIELDQLALFKRMTETGAETVSENVTAMTGVETLVEISHLNFVPIENAPAEIDEGEHVAVVVRFSGEPSGYVMILFDEASAHNVVQALVPDASGEEFGAMERSAIREIGNIMTSSFVDGWANVLNTTIDISTPRFIHDLGRAIMDPIVVELGRHQEFVFLADAKVSAANSEFDFQLYALPNERELERALTSLEADYDEPTDRASVRYPPTDERTETGGADFE